MKQTVPSVRLSILVSPLGILLESTWTDVPPVKAVTTAEEMIRCWCTVGEWHKPPILIYSLSVVMMSTHLYKYLDTYLYTHHWKTTEELSSPWMVKNNSGRHFFHMSHKILNDISLSRLSFSSLLLCVNTQEYLYRFVALATGGWTAGPWQRGRSRGTGKLCVCEWHKSWLFVCECEICVSIHYTWGIFPMGVRTFLSWNISRLFYLKPPPCRIWDLFKPGDITCAWLHERLIRPL